MMNSKVKHILKLQDEERNRYRLRRLFPNTTTPKQEYPASPEEGMKGLLADINEFDDQHAEVFEGDGDYTYLTKRW